MVEGDNPLAGAQSALRALSGPFVPAIYGAPARPDATVLIVRGVANSLAAAEHYFSNFACLSFTGEPAYHDWSALANRKVHLWPDAGANGALLMQELGTILIGLNVEVTIHDQEGQPDWWNLTVALADGMTLDQIRAHANRDKGKHAHKVKPTIIKRGKPRVIELVDADKSLSVLKDELNLQLNSAGLIHPTEANALRILEGAKEFKDRIWLDAFSQRLMIDERRFDKIDAIHAQEWMQRTMEFHKLPLSAVERAVQLIGARNQRHELKDWLEGLTWDGTPRLSHWLSHAYGSPQNAYSAAVGRCWLVSAVARIFKPGCKADYAIVLEGPQGVKKSSSLRILGGQWFLESHINPIRQQKDFLGGLQGYWIIELPEMAHISGERDGINAIKGMITCQVDNYRRPYGATSMEYPRQCIFAGTTNEAQWNSDSTGGRRFWPIQCRSISLDYLADNRDQLFAEAMAQFNLPNPQWWDVPQGDAKEQQEARRQVDPWEEYIERFITHQPTRHEDRTVTWQARDEALSTLHIGIILEDAIGKPSAHWTRSDQMRVSATLGAMGFTKQRTQLTDGSRPWVYRKGVI